MEPDSKSAPQEGQKPRIIRCGECGRELELPAGVADGKRVQCPFCGEKTIWKEPTRIEVPEGADLPRMKAEDVPEQHPSGEISEMDLKAIAILRRMHEENILRAAEAEKAANARRRALRSSVMRACAAIVLAAVCICAACVWRAKAKASRHAREAEIREKRWSEAEEAERRSRELESIEQAKKRLLEEEILRQEREKSGGERRMREDSSDSEKLRLDEERRRLDEERRRLDEERAAQQAAAEKARRAEEAKTAERNAAREHYLQVEKSFMGATPQHWGELAADKRPGAAAGAFSCLFPGPNEGFEMFELDSVAGGVSRAVRLLPGGDVAEVAFSDVAERMKSVGCFVNNGAGIYLMCPASNGEPMPVPPDSVCPARLSMGATYALCERMSMNTSRIGFDVRVTVAGGQKPVFERAAGFGDSISPREIDEAVRAAAAAAVPKPKADDRPVRTVFLYDGNVIRKRPDGVTLVPRSPRRMDAQWRALHDKAIQQEKDEASGPSLEGAARYNAAVEEKFKRMRASSVMSVSVRTAAR